MDHEIFVTENCGQVLIFWSTTWMDESFDFTIENRFFLFTVKEGHLIMIIMARP